MATAESIIKTLIFCIAKWDWYWELPMLQTPALLIELVTSGKHPSSISSISQKFPLMTVNSCRVFPCVSICFHMSESLMFSLFWDLVPFTSYSLSPRTYQVMFQTNIYLHNRNWSAINIVIFNKLLHLSSVLYLVNQLTIRFSLSCAVHPVIICKGIIKMLK